MGVILKMSEEPSDISLTLRYGDVKRIKESIKRVLLHSIETEDEIEKRKARRIYVSLPYESRSKLKIAALQALKEVGYWDPEIFDSVFSLAKNDPDFEVKKLAEETILSVLEKTKHKKESLMQVLRAINKREILISPVDAVKASGEETAKKLLEDETLSKDMRDLIKFCLDTIKGKKE